MYGIVASTLALHKHRHETRDITPHVPQNQRCCDGVLCLRKTSPGTQNKVYQTPTGTSEGTFSTPQGSKTSRLVSSRHNEHHHKLQNPENSKNAPSGKTRPDSRVPRLQLPEVQVETAAARDRQRPKKTARSSIPSSSSSCRARRSRRRSNRGGGGGAGGGGGIEPGNGVDDSP